MTKLPDLQEALSPLIQDAVDAALARLGAGLLIERVEADARLQDALGPVVLHRHELVVLASLVEGCELEDLGELQEQHFYGRGRRHAFRLLRQAAIAHEPTGLEALTEMLLIDCHTTTVVVAEMLREIAHAPCATGETLRALGVELRAASALNDYAHEVRRMMAETRTRAACHQQAGALAGALDVAGLRKRLRGANLALADGLKGAS